MRCKNYSAFMVLKNSFRCFRLIYVKKYDAVSLVLISLCVRVCARECLMPVFIKVYVRSALNSFSSATGPPF